MHTIPSVDAPQVAENEWIMFPGGELEGKRPNVLCPECREKLHLAAGSATVSRPGARRPDSARRTGGGWPHRPPLCFACYRAALAHERAFRTAAEIDTASDTRFQSALPFEPVNHARLERLRVERAAVRLADRAGVGHYTNKRRQAQIAARHALENIAAGVHARNAATAERERVMLSALHAAELQLPDAWLPFVMSR
jgi:hypothetical protein